MRGGKALGPSNFSFSFGDCPWKFLKVVGRGISLVKRQNIIRRHRSVVYLCTRCAGIACMRVQIVNKIFKRRNSNREQNRERTSISKRGPSSSCVLFTVLRQNPKEDDEQLVLARIYSVIRPTAERERPKQSKQAKTSAQPSRSASSAIVFRYPVRPASAHLQSLST